MSKLIVSIQVAESRVEGRVGGRKRDSVLNLSKRVSRGSGRPELAKARRKKPKSWGIPKGPVIEMPVI